MLQVRSIQTSEGVALLASLEREAGREVVEEELDHLADAFMLEDMVRRQKLEAEVAEGEEAVKGFQPKVTAVEEVKEEVEEEEKVEEEKEGGLDLTPSLGGTQTLTLTGPGGEWKSQVPGFPHPFRICFFELNLIVSPGGGRCRAAARWRGEGRPAAPAPALTLLPPGLTRATLGLWCLISKA